MTKLGALAVSLSILGALGLTSAAQAQGIVKVTTTVRGTAAF